MWRPEDKVTILDIRQWVKGSLRQWLKKYRDPKEKKGINGGGEILKEKAESMSYNGTYFPPATKSVMCVLTNTENQF